MAYTYAQLEGYWANAAAQLNDPTAEAEAPVAAAIALAESSGSNVVQQGQPYDTTGWGLWQITPGNSVPNVATDNGLLDPNLNALAAVTKFQAAGNSFQPWTTYTSGKYMQFLQQGVAPDSSVQTGAATLTSLNLPGIGGLGSITNIASAGTNFAQLLSKLLQPTWWKRVGKMGLAILLGFVAVTYLFGPSHLADEAKNIGSTAAVVAA